MAWDNEAAQEAYEAGQEAAKVVAAQWAQKARTFGKYSAEFWEGVLETIQEA